jgi:hypothetical protein
MPNGPPAVPTRTDTGALKFSRLSRSTAGGVRSRQQRARLDRDRAQALRTRGGVSRGGKRRGSFRPRLIGDAGPSPCRFGFERRPGPRNFVGRLWPCAGSRPSARRGLRCRAGEAAPHLPHPSGTFPVQRSFSLRDHSHSGGAMKNVECDRLEQDSRGELNWKRWGPYLAERQWATVREDYSPGGEVWDSVTHDRSRSRAYRWGEDGLLGITDRQCRVAFAIALWNGADPFLKFGRADRSCRWTTSRKRSHSISLNEPARGRRTLLATSWTESRPMISRVRWRTRRNLSGSGRRWKT